MNYISYKEIVKYLNIKNGDRILISSDITNLVITSQENNEKFEINEFINSIIDAIGENGTLVFPTYNWGFCKGKTFDYYKTRSKTGILGTTALKRTDFKRSNHPIYSFAVWGKDKDIICNINNISSFGSDSPFGYFYNNNFKNLILDVDYSSCFTFVHFVEAQVGNLPYRYDKIFTAKYTDEFGETTMREYSMYVRDLDLNVRGDCNPLGKILEENGIAIPEVINGIRYVMVDLYNAYPIIKDDIVSNRSRNICTYIGQED